MNTAGSSTTDRFRMRTPADNRVSDDALESSPARPAHVPWRTALNYWVDASLAVTLLTLCGVTTVLQFVFPAGHASDGLRLLNRTVEDWRRLQFAAVNVLAVLTVVHVTLHWNWVCSITSTLVLRRPPGRDHGSRTLVGVAILLALLHAFAAIFLFGRLSLTAN
jgi:hypothetical protein